MFLGKRKSVAAILFCLSAPVAAVAAGTISIQYQLVPMGGNVYRYVYSVTNNGSLGNNVNVQLFDILFDRTFYGSPAIVTPAPLSTQWLQSLIPIPAAPVEYDAFALTGGIPVGSTVNGFSVQFSWLGPGLPTSQPYLVEDPSTFAVLQVGNTTAVPNASVPLAPPPFLILIAVGLILVAALCMRAQTRAQVRTEVR